MSRIMMCSNKLYEIFVLSDYCIYVSMNHYCCLIIEWQSSDLSLDLVFKDLRSIL